MPAVNDTLTFRAGETPTSPRRQGGAERVQDHMPLPLLKQGGSKDRTPIPNNGRLAWAGFLAIASDLQLIPRLMGIDALQAAVEQVSVMPHRVEKDAGLVSRYFI